LGYAIKIPSERGDTGEKKKKLHQKKPSTRPFLLETNVEFRGKNGIRGGFVWKNKSLGNWPWQLFRLRGGTSAKSFGNLYARSSGKGEVPQKKTNKVRLGETFRSKKKKDASTRKKNTGRGKRVQWKKEPAPPKGKELFAKVVQSGPEKKLNLEGCQKEKGKARPKKKKTDEGKKKKVHRGEAKKKNLPPTRRTT